LGAVESDHSDPQGPPQTREFRKEHGARDTIFQQFGGFGISPDGKQDHTKNDTLEARVERAAIGVDPSQRPARLRVSTCGAT
jgi:hypothetical protein